MAAEGTPLAASLMAAALCFFAIALGIAISRSRSGILRLGLISSLRRPVEAAYPALPVALVGAVVLASLGTGDNLEAMVRSNVEENMSGVGAVVEFPDPIVLTNASEAALLREGIVPALFLKAAGHGERSSNVITVIGAESTILSLLPASGPEGEVTVPEWGALINRRASDELGAMPGDIIELRLSAYDARNLVLKSDLMGVLFASTVETVIADSGIGRFRTDARGGTDPTVIVDLDVLSERLGEAGAVNRLLCPVGMTGPQVRSIVEDAVGWEDLGFEIVPYANGLLVRNDDFMFRDPQRIGNATLSYFVDSISFGNVTVPYSTTVSGHLGPYLSPKAGEVMASDLTATRLGVAVGDRIAIDYRYVDEHGLLSVGNISLVVVGIVPIGDLIPLKGLIPPIEGLTDRPSCSDWAPAFGVDIDRVTAEDIAYWDAYGTTPKLVMNLSDARASFGSVFGDTTGLLTGSTSDATGSMLDDRVDIGYMGGRVVDARGIALGSDRGMKIFPMMFLTFGTTIIIAASLSLWGTLKGRSARRTYEWGISRNMGLRRRDLFLSSILDASPSIFLGIAISVPLGYAISYLLSGPLGPAWSGTGQHIGLAVVPSTALFSTSASFVVSILVVAAISALEARQSVGSQVRGEREVPPVAREGIIPSISAAGAFIGTALILLSTLVEDGSISSALFVIGASLASAGTAVIMLWALTSVSDRSAGRLLVTANLRRRHVLTPVIVATLAITVGMAVAMSAIGSGLEGSVERTATDFGAGHDRYAELAAPNSEMLDRAIDSLEEEGYRVSALSSVGDRGGSCTNINAPFPPRLIGIPPDLELGLSRWSDRYGGPQEVLDRLGSTSEGRVPILVDENTLVWIYRGGLGSIYTVTAEDGRPIELVVVGVLSPSVLSGSFVMADRPLKEAYPRAAKDSILLIKDPPSGGDDTDVSGILSGLAPDVRTVRELALEDLEYELGYLYLFRGFLVIGIVTGISSAVSFTAARTVERSTDHAMLRSVGATRRTIGMALMAENGIVFGTASAGALVVGVLAGALSVPVGDPDMAAIVWGSLLVPAIVVLFGLAFSAVGSYLATREIAVRRRDG